MTREEAIQVLKMVEAYGLADEAKRMAIEALDAEAVQGDAISKQFVSDAILQKISELNAQGEKAIPIAREFIRFKRFVDGITPISVETVQGEWIMHGEPPWYVRECSECGTKWHQWSGDSNPNYCGNCGAKMDGERSEE